MRVVKITLQQVCKTVMWEPVNEEGLLHVKEVTVLVSSVAVVYMLYKLNEQSVAQFKILSCLHGEFENNHEKHVKIVSLPPDI